PRFPSFVGVRIDAYSDEAPPARKPRRSGKGAKLTTPGACQPAASATTSQVRRFELSEGKSHKFWEVSLTGCDVTVRYGRIGAQGQTKTQSFANATAAQAHAD